MDTSLDAHKDQFPSSEAEAQGANAEAQSKISQLNYALGPGPIEADQTFVDQIQQYVGFLKTPMIHNMLSHENERTIAQAENLCKSIEIMIAYKQSHPDTTDIKLVGVNSMTPEGFSRLGIQKRSMTPRFNITTSIHEALSRRDLMGKINNIYNERIEREVKNLDAYKILRTVNGGNTTFPSMVTDVYLELTFRKPPLTSPVILDSLVLNLAESPIILSVKNPDTSKQMTTLLGGTTKISKVIFNHDSPSSGATHRKSVLDSKDDLLKKVDDLTKVTTKALISNKMYQNLFKDEYLNFFTEFRKDISTDAINAAIAQSYSLMTLAGSKRTMWVLTSGMQWVFGVVSIEESGKTICYVSDVKKINTDNDLREIMLTVFYWASTPSSEVLNLYDIAQDA